MTVSSTGAEAETGGGATSISADGTSVVLSSSSSNLVPDDTNGFQDIFVHDLATGVTERVSVSSVGEQANGFSFIGTISANGRFSGLRV